MRKTLLLVFVTFFLTVSCNQTDKIENDLLGRQNNYLQNANNILILYNSKELTLLDRTSINKYLNLLRKKNNLLAKDVSSYANAIDIYIDLKNEFQHKTISGLQIFGISDDVPSFDIRFSVDTQNGIYNLESYKSDFFYSSFITNPQYLIDFSLHNVFYEKKDVNFIPEWKIARLPLERGEYKRYFTKYLSYLELTRSSNNIPLIIFSNPISPTKEHIDDYGYFFKERLDGEFHLLNNSQYKIYGNTEGAYPIGIDTWGGLTKENIKKENELGIADFLICSHGQQNNIDHVIFSSENPRSESRNSLLNSKDINVILSKNYYNLYTWTCYNAWNLYSNNLIHKAIADGNCVNALAATSVVSDIGTNNKASLEDMKYCNPFYFQYIFYMNLYKYNTSRCDSFYLAKKAYGEEIIKNKKNSHYSQLNLHNLIAYHFLGVIEP